jgi:hypothetical protein
MKRALTSLGTAVAWTPPALAAGGTETAGTSLFTILLVVFGALVVVGQFIPGMVLFTGMMKGLFGTDATKTTPAAVHNRNSQY